MLSSSLYLTTAGSGCNGVGGGEAADISSLSVHVNVEVVGMCEPGARAMEMVGTSAMDVNQAGDLRRE